MVTTTGVPQHPAASAPTVALGSSSGVWVFSHTQKKICCLVHIMSSSGGHQRSVAFKPKVDRVPEVFFIS